MPGLVDVVRAGSARLAFAGKCSKRQQDVFGSISSIR